MEVLVVMKTSRSSSKIIKTQIYEREGRKYCGKLEPTID